MRQMPGRQKGTGLYLWWRRTWNSVDMGGVSSVESRDTVHRSLTLVQRLVGALLLSLTGHVNLIKVITSLSFRVIIHKIQIPIHKPVLKIRGNGYRRLFVTPKLASSEAPTFLL